MRGEVGKEIPTYKRDVFYDVTHDTFCISLKSNNSIVLYVIAAFKNITIRNYKNIIYG